MSRWIFARLLIPRHWMGRVADQTRWNHCKSNRARSSNDWLAMLIIPPGLLRKPSACRLIPRDKGAVLQIPKQRLSSHMVMGQNHGTLVNSKMTDKWACIPQNMVHVCVYTVYMCIYIYIFMHCITLHYITLHCIALHYITLHYIT